MVVPCMRSTDKALMTLGLLLSAVLLASPAFAQSTGMIRGIVTGSDGAPLVGIKVVIEAVSGPQLVLESETNDNGRYRQMGLRPNQYRVTVDAEGVGSQQVMLTLRAGDSSEVNFDLAAAAAAATAALSEEDLAKVERNEDLKAAFEAGVQAASAGNYEEAVVQFSAAAVITDTCYDCFHNLGIAHAELDQSAEAEAAFKRAISTKPDNAASYMGLAKLYNTQRRFDEAAEASAEAARLSGTDGAGSTNPVAVFNQGIIFWNAQKFGEAKAQFQQTLSLDPEHADAHYFLAMVNLNEGNMPEATSALERYLELAPNGQYADQAMGILPQIQQ